MDYSFSADFMNKFSQLTPWVQAVLGVSGCAMVLGVAYVVTQTVTRSIHIIAATAHLLHRRRL